MSTYQYNDRSNSYQLVNFYSNAYPPDQYWNEIDSVSGSVDDIGEVFVLRGMLKTVFHVIQVGGSAPTFTITVYGTLDGVSWSALPDTAATITTLGIVEVATPVAAIKLHYNVSVGKIQVRAMAHR